jgi:hypothetical protein
MEELDWLLKDTHKDLVRVLKLMEGSLDPALDRRADELFWTFAVLWHDPPAGQPADVEAFLAERAILDHVRRRRDRLTPLQ